MKSGVELCSFSFQCVEHRQEIAIGFPQEFYSEVSILYPYCVRGRIHGKGFDIFYLITIEYFSLSLGFKSLYLLIQIRLHKPAEFIG
jgi:hypothetical protein